MFGKAAGDIETELCNSNCVDDLGATELSSLLPYVWALILFLIINASGKVDVFFTHSLYIYVYVFPPIDRRAIMVK